MARTKYYYNSETCKYEQIKTKPGNVVLTLFIFLIGIILFSIAFVWTGYKFEIFETQEIVELKAEIKHLKNHNEYHGKQIKYL